jgi:hypothetical protein
LGEGLVLVLRLFGAVLALSLLAGASAFAQSAPSAVPPPSLPLRGFISAFETLRIVRAAGFDPLAPPLRQGTTYVVRAIDFRGIAMRVVVDARSGVIRDANRIVSGPGLYGPYAPGPYGPVYYGRLGPPPPHLGPPDELYIGAGELAPSEDELRAVSLHGPHSGVTTLIPAVPLPRPRPAGLSAAGASEAKPASKPDVAAGAPPTQRSGSSSKAATGSTLTPIND